MITPAIAGAQDMVVMRRPISPLTAPDDSSTYTGSHWSPDFTHPVTHADGDAHPLSDTGPAYLFMADRGLDMGCGDPDLHDDGYPHADGHLRR